MKFAAHRERQTAFQRKIFELDLLHGTITPGKPWQNGIIERSNRTDNDELFHRTRFEDSESRRYQFRLWENYYNITRPHPSLGMRTPMEVYLKEYRIHSAGRMLN